MCGVLGVIANPKAKVKIDANEKIIYQYEDQYKRGQEGFGIVRFSNGKIDGIDRACTPTKFLMDLTTHKSESIIAHHRMPTSTDNKIDQTHPIFVSNKELKYDYYVVHNGVIRNDTELKKYHEKLGYKYRTEVTEEKWSGGYYSTQYSRVETKWNDSETMAIDLARYIENLQRELKIEGSAAFIAIQVEKGTDKIQKIFFGRRLNPIKIESEKGYIILSSEGKGKEIDARELFSVNIAKPKFEKGGKYKMHKRKMLFEDERLEKEKKTKEDKEDDERKKKNEEKRINNMGVDQTNPLNLPFKQELATIKPEEQARKLLNESKQSDDEKAYHQELKDVREYFEGQLYNIEQEYGEAAKKGVDRDLRTIESDIYDAFDGLKDLIGEIISSYTDIMIEPGYCTEDEKPRRTMTMQMISKVINSLENIANYESSIIEQKNTEKDEEDMDMKSWNESFGITDKGKKALKETKYNPRDNHEEEYTGYSHYPGRGVYGCGDYLD
jgi:predicted glutamine amidotransferase